MQFRIIYGWADLNRKKVSIIAIALVAVVILSLFVALNSFSNHQANTEFYFGVEFAYGDQPIQVQALVDKVRGYTNLVVLGSLELTLNQSSLNEACDKIFKANLNFIVLFTGLEKYDYNITTWMTDASVKYGERFLGIYRYDEPGGNQLDNGPSQLIHSYDLASNPSYAQLSEVYTGNLSYFPAYYLQYSPKIYTSDYGLYWFDYKANYTTIFGEFVGNESRERHIALCRGAAEAFGKDWGVIVTWKYDHAPYLGSPEELYSDLTLAYRSGAKYLVVFSYPNTTNYGTITEQHFEKMREFWNIIHKDPQSLGKNNVEAAYVVPSDYGFGFRSAKDNIWGLFPPDGLSPKIFNDVDLLIGRYGERFDILYDSPQASVLLPSYGAVYFWNQTIS